MANHTDADPVLSPLTQDAISLAQLVSAHGLSHPNLSALVIDNKTISYGDLIKKTRQLASVLKKNNIQRLGILASKSLEAYLGVLAAHWLGCAYVPLNPRYPLSRLKKIIESAQLDGYIVDALRKPMVENFVLTSSATPFKKITLEDIQAEDTISLAASKVEATDLAYIIFTSGSSGEPKGVPISFGNLGSFIKAVSARYPLTAKDRVSQFSTLSFDVSVFDMGLAFSAGAALYVVPDDTQMAPAKFIYENQLSVWLSVPSVINNMARLKILRPNGFPTLKYSLFTGEALTLAQAQAWAVAAPASQLENLYGPTEVTIDCLGQIYEPNENFYRDQVAIGKPFAKMIAALIDVNEKFLPPGQKGQLVIAGPQVAEGYWHDNNLSAQKFKKLTHPDWGMQGWFLTGDYCYQDSHAVFHYINRLDSQAKILGNRVELEEIEFYFRAITECNEVAACIVTVGDNPEIVVVTNFSKLDFSALVAQLAERLPKYMLPARMLYRDALIYNTNGKLDRTALAEWVKSIESSTGESAC